MGKHKMVLGLSAAFVLVLAVLGLRYLNEGPSVKSLEADDTATRSANDHHLHPQQLGVAAQGNTSGKGVNGSHDQKLDATAGGDQPRHIDMLSDEMKQSIRGQLLQHGPKKTFTKPDGTVVLPASGRATQVSVAVQMPDGSIQIREYTELPEGQAASTPRPVYKVSTDPR